jgi:DNA-directed RNA polymerase subunit alpha
MKIWIILRHETNGETIVLGTAYTDQAVVHHVLELLRDMGGVFSCRELSTLGSNTPAKQLSDVDILGLTIRTSNILKAAGIFNIEGITQAGENELRKLPNSGARTLNEIREALSKRGIALGK